MTTDRLAPRVGISACLMGEQVRYNGGHQRDNFVMDVLAQHVELVPVCPEVEAGRVSRDPSCVCYAVRGATRSSSHRAA